MNPLQAALQIIDDQNPDPVIGATARGLMRGYHAKWVGSAWRTVSVETEYHLPIVNPDTGRTSRTWTHAGKKDGLAEYEGGTWLVEHKTCSEDIQNPDAPYWRRLDIDAQVSGYVLANWQEGLKLAGTLYDVIRKPMVRPKQIVKIDRQGIISTGMYFGAKVREETRINIGQLDKETPDLFEMRLAAETIEKPAYYFARRSIPRMDDQLLDYARELWQTADEMRLARANNSHYRNSGACMNYGIPCKFLGLCSGHDSPDSDKWTRKKSVHSELEGIEGDGRDVLSHSRMACFKLCKRKHYYQYELGIERLDREDSDSLVFGKLLHEGLAAYWQALTPEGEPCPST